MTELFVFSVLILGIAWCIWAALALLWRAGLWKVARNIRKRGEREARLREEEVRNAG